MKKYFNLSFAFAIVGMLAGVFYREFTKLNGFTGVTTLGKLHGHLFTLGMIMFLIVGILVFQLGTALTQQPLFCKFSILYPIGVIATTVMILVRGVTEVLDIALSKGADAAISGLSGVAHIITAVAIICLFLGLKKAIARTSETE